MKRISSRHLPGLLAEIHVTPMLDLMLMLLLAVMVLVPVLKSEGRAGQGSQPSKSIELVVAPDLKLTLAGQVVSEKDLIPNLQKRVEASSDLGVVVRVPPTLTTPALLQIMDALNAATVKHTAVVSEPPPKTP
jgi:biopolymer transport protein ExbD